MRPRRLDDREHPSKRADRASGPAGAASAVSVLDPGTAARRPPEERAQWVGQLGGNAAAAGVLARQATAAPPAPEGSKALTPAEEAAKATSDLVALASAAAGSLVGSKQKYAGKLVAEWIPGVLRARITKGAKKPKAKADNPLEPLWDTLYSEEFKTALTALDTASAPKGSKKARAKKQQAARIRLLMAILGRLLPDVSAGADVQAPGTALDAAKQVEEEKKLVTGNLKRLTVSKSKGKTVDKWENIRVPVLVQFGALSVGSREALNRATAYYDQLVQGELFGSRLHGGSLVHPDLQQAFNAATRYVEDRDDVDDETKEALRDTAKTGFSTNIRENRNAKDQLSDHSFGWAVDFDAADNPNIGKGAAEDPVRHVTGTDPRSILKTSDRRTAAEMEQAAETLRTISSDYTKAMESKESLAPVLLRIANEGRAKAKLGELDAASAAALAEAATAEGAGSETTLRAAVFPEGAAATAAVPAPITQAVATLEMVGDTFNASFKTVKGKQVRTAATTEATAGSVAAHGFMSLPALFAAALSGTDAGGLRWLQHDRMHFELVNEPELYGATPPPKDEAHD